MNKLSRRWRIKTFGAVFSVLSACSVVSAGTALGAESGCPADTVISASDLTDGVISDCSYDNVSVDMGDGILMNVPPLGQTVEASGVVMEGYPLFPEVTVHRSSDGGIAASLEDQMFGSGTALSELETLLPTDQPTDQISAGGVCDDPNAYSLAGHSWTGTYKWWFNGAGEAVPGWSLPLIQNAMNTVTNGLTRCGSSVLTNATHAYQGAGTYVVGINDTGGCTGNDQHSTIGFGKLPKGTLALAWSHYIGSINVDADIMFNNRDYFWYHNRGSACSGNFYDLQGIATHEAGHAFGLNHVAQSTGQVMKPMSSPCELSQQKLGLGDAWGLKALYG